MEPAGKHSRVPPPSSVWAMAVIGTLAAIHASVRIWGGPFGTDAAYYYQIARHVMRGEGLVTTASLYLEGWQLPARTAIYPLWPLLLGYVARVSSLPAAAVVLPKLLYVATLSILYLVARRVASDLGAPRIGGPAAPDVAIAVVALFGLNRLFFASTVHPYTEGLAFTCAVMSFWLLGKFEGERRTGWAFAAGAFASLAFLARAQMLWVSVGAVVVLTAIAVKRADTRRGVVAYVAGAAAAILPWLIYLRHVPWLESVTGRGTLSPRTTLPPFQMYAATETVAGWLLDRARAAAVMFHIASPVSYVSTFGIAALLVPVAAVVALLRLRRGERKAPTVLVASLTLSGTFFLANLAMYRGEFFLEWLFGWRHGLPLIFLLVVAVPYLLTVSPRAGRVIVLAALVVSIATSGRQVYAFVTEPRGSMPQEERELVAWLDAQQGTPTVVTTRAQLLSSYSDVHFHWIDCSVDPATTEVMLDRLHIDYVVVYERERMCPFIGPIAPKFEVVARFGPPGRSIFVVRRRG